MLGGAGAWPRGSGPMRGAEAGGGRGVPPPRRCARPRRRGGSGRRRRALGLSGRGAGTGTAGSGTGGTRRDGHSGRSHGSLRPTADQRLHAAGGGLGPGPAPRPSLGEAAEEGGRTAVLSPGIHPVGLPGSGPAAAVEGAAGPVRSRPGAGAARRGGARRRGREGGRGGQVMAGRRGRCRGGSPRSNRCRPGHRLPARRCARAERGRRRAVAGPLRIPPPHPRHRPAPPAGGGTVTGFWFEWCGLGQGLRGAHVQKW